MRLRTLALAALVALLLPALATGAPGGSFVVVENDAAVLASAEIPNASGAIRVPPGFERSTDVAQTVSPARLRALWQRAGAAYGIPWEVLAAINKIESNFGRNMGPSSAGAVG